MNFVFHPSFRNTDFVLSCIVTTCLACKNAFKINKVTGLLSSRDLGICILVTSSNNLLQKSVSLSHYFDDICVV